MRVNLGSIRRHRFSSGCAAVLLLAIAAGWWLQRPSYLELPIPVKPSPHFDYFWWETHFAQLHYADARGALFVYRKVGRAYTNIQGWSTTAEAMGYFDDWLREHDWQYEEREPSGDPILPESRFLQPGTEYRLYRRPGDLWGDGPRIGVAIDPVDEGIFDVTLVTSQPSWLRRLWDSFDD